LPLTTMRQIDAHLICEPPEAVGLSYLKAERA
jgi:hypothetical protein